MAVRSDVIIDVSTVVAGGSVTYTTPSGERTLVKYVSWRFGALGDRWTVEVDNGDGTFRAIIDKTSTAANESFSAETFIVLRTGDRIRLRNQGAANGTGGAFGAKLVV